MNLLAMMTWLEHRPFAIAIAESTWLFPIVETVHVLALTVVVGSVGMMDLRLLGVGSKDRAASEVISSSLPWAWSAFAVAFVAGSMLFSSKAATYYVNLPFRIKMLCLARRAVRGRLFPDIVGRHCGSGPLDRFHLT